MYCFSFIFGVSSLLVNPPIFSFLGGSRFVASIFLREFTHLPTAADDAFWQVVLCNRHTNSEVACQVFNGWICELT